MASSAQEDQETVCRTIVEGTDFLDLAAGVIRANTADGESLVIPIEQVRRAVVRAISDETQSPVSLRFDALVSGDSWQPAGRVRKVVLGENLTIAFDDVAPGLDMQKKVLFWSTEGEYRVEIPYEDIFFIEFRNNRFVSDINSLADYAVIDALKTDSGETIDLSRRFAEWVDDRRVIAVADPPVEHAIADLRSISVGDVRRREEWPPAETAPVPAVLVEPDIPFQEQDSTVPDSQSTLDDDTEDPFRDEPRETSSDKYYRLPSGSWAHVRRGICLGLNIGAGSASPMPYGGGGSSGGIGGTLRAGIAVSNKFLLSFEPTFWIGNSGEKDVGFDLYSFRFVLTWYPRNTGFFIRGGLGSGSAELVYSMMSAVSYDGSSQGLGFGHEWRLTRKFALGIALDYSRVDVEPIMSQSEFRFTNLTLQLNWY